MSTPFGPWCTGIDAQSSPHLSTFWKRRMAMLPDLAAHPGPPTRRQALLAGLAGLGLACWPTLRPGLAVETAGIPDDSEGMLYLYADFIQIPSEDVEGQEVADGRGIIAVDPESGEWDLVDRRLHWSSFSLSPDGKMIASGDIENLEGGAAIRQTNVTLFNLERPDEPPRTICEFGDGSVWSGDGSELIVPLLTFEPGQSAGRRENWRMNADGTNRVKLPVPESHFVTDWSPDGRWIATTSSEHPGGARGSHIYIMRPDGTDRRQMSRTEDLGSSFARFSPDGRQLAFVVRRSIVIVDVDGGNRRQFRPSDAPNPAYFEIDWSPDGRRLACITANWDREAATGLAKYRTLIMDVEDGAARTLRIANVEHLDSLHWLPKS